MPIPKRKVRDLAERLVSLLRNKKPDFIDFVTLINEAEFLPVSSVDEAIEKFTLLCALSSYNGDTKNTQKYYDKVKLYNYNQDALINCLLSFQRRGLFRRAWEISNQMIKIQDPNVLRPLLDIAFSTGHFSQFTNISERLRKMQTSIEEQDERYISENNVINYTSSKQVSDDELFDFISIAARIVGENCKFINGKEFRNIEGFGLSYTFYVTESKMSMFELDSLVVDALLEDDRYANNFSEIITFSVERQNPSRKLRSEPIIFDNLNTE